jgi:hypothetical protein
LSCKRAWRKTEDGSTLEQQAHLKSLPECSALVAELNLIAASAIALRGADEPSPRVWNSLEIALRQEGLIRPQRTATCRPVARCHPSAAAGVGTLGASRAGHVAVGCGNIRSSAFVAQQLARIKPPGAVNVR